MAERRAKEGEDPAADAASNPPARAPHSDERKRTEAAAPEPPEAAPPVPAKNGARVKDEAGSAVVPPVPVPAGGPWRSYKEIVSQLAARIVEAQRPIRVLQSLRWDD